MKEKCALPHFSTEIHPLQFKFGEGERHDIILLEGSRLSRSTKREN
jgi:hypothetical protein